MDQDIAETNYPREIRDGRGRRRVDPSQLVQGLADDLELSFAGGSQLVVRTVVSEGLARGETVDTVGRLAGVQRSLPASACIEGAGLGPNLLPEVRVGEAAVGDQVHRATNQGLQAGL